MADLLLKQANTNRETKKDSVREFLDLHARINHCNKCRIRKNDYCFYGLNSGQKYIMILQNPGTGIKKNNTEYFEINNAGSDREKIEIMRKYLSKWMLSQSKPFFERFFSTLKDHKLIDFSNFKNYINSKQYLDDFYFTDAVKCRAKTEVLAKEYFENCFDYLKYELEMINPDLIFSFGSRTWEIVKKKLFPETIKTKPIDKNSGVTKAHGYLFRISIDSEKQTHLMPLAHMSPRQVNNYLRDSYFDYLNEGLEVYRSLGI